MDSQAHFVIMKPPLAKTKALYNHTCNHTHTHTAIYIYTVYVCILCVDMHLKIESKLLFAFAGILLALALYKRIFAHVPSFGGVHPLPALATDTLRTTGPQGWKNPSSPLRARDAPRSPLAPGSSKGQCPSPGMSEGLPATDGTGSTNEVFHFEANPF